MTTTTITIEGCIYEQGNGWADIGDYVAGADDELYRVVEFIGPIHAGSPGAGNWIHAVCELADWGDIDNDDDVVCFFHPGDEELADWDDYDDFDDYDSDHDDDGRPA